MATERLVIVVKSEGTGRTKRDIQSVGGAARKAGGDVQFLKQAMVALFGVVALRGAQRLIDSYTQIENRIKVVTNGTVQLAQVTERLFAVSNKTRSSFQATAEVYSRTAFAARELGLTQEQVIQFTENLNKAVIVGGARSKEAINGLIQLSQGIASNRLGGEEFRSVTEQLPVVADAIAKKLNITRGDLIKLAKQGKITSQVMVDAILEAGDELEEKFGRIDPTIEQSFQVLSNRVIGFVGQFNAATGASVSFARSIIELSKHMDTLASSIFTVFTMMALTFGPQVVGMIIGRITMIGAAMVAALSNPITGTVVAIGTLVAAFVTLGRNWKVFGNTVREQAGVPVGPLEASNAEGPLISNDNIKEQVNVLDLAKAAWNDLKQEVGLFGSQVRSVLDDVEGYVQQFIPKFSISWSGFFKVLATVADFILNLLNGSVKFLFNFVNDSLLVISKAIQETLGFYEDMINKVADSRIGKFLQWERADFIPDDVEIQESFGELGSRSFEAFIEEFNKNRFSDKLDKLLADAEAEAQARLALNRNTLNDKLDGEARGTVPEREGKAKKINRRFQEIIQGLQDEIKLLGIASEEREFQAELLAKMRDAGRALLPYEFLALAALIKQKQTLAAENEIVEQITADERERVRTESAIARLQAKGVEHAKEYRRILLDIKASRLEDRDNVFDAMEAGLLRVVLAAENFGQKFSDFVVGSFETATQSIIDFSQTGKFEFKQFINSILQDMLRLATNQFWAQLIQFLPAAFGSFGGGASGASGGTGPTPTSTSPFYIPPGFGGGVNSAPTNAGPGAVSVGGPQINLRNINVLDPNLIIDAMSTPAGEAAVLNILSRNPDALGQVGGA